MVRVEDEECLERGGQVVVDVVLFDGSTEGEAEVVLDVAEAVLRVLERLTDGGLVRVRGQRRHRTDETKRCFLDVLRIVGIEVLAVERAEAHDACGEQHHRVAAAREGTVELTEALVEHHALGDLRGEIVELRLGRELAVDQEVGNLKERGLLSELLDRVAAVTQDALLAVNVGDRRLARSSVDETGVQGGVPGGSEDLRDVQTAGPFGRRYDREIELSFVYLQNCIVSHVVPF